MPSLHRLAYPAPTNRDTVPPGVEEEGYTGPSVTGIGNTFNQPSKKNKKT